MADRELLTRAAKVAGMRTRPDWYDALLGVAVVDDERGNGPAERWNPLESDAEALRLAVKLGFELFLNAGRIVQAVHHESGAYGEEWKGDDPYAATRRAIVVAAAALEQEEGQ